MVQGMPVRVLTALMLLVVGNCKDGRGITRLERYDIDSWAASRFLLLRLEDTPSGDLLLAQLRSNPEVLHQPETVWANDVSEPVLRYRRDTGCIEKANRDDWRRAKIVVNPRQGSCREAGLFRVRPKGYEDLEFDGKRVPTAGKYVQFAILSPDEHRLAVYSFSSLDPGGWLFSGGGRGNPKGPYYVDVFNVGTGKRIGLSAKLNDSERSRPFMVWAGDKCIVFFDSAACHLWVLPMSDYAATEPK